MSTDTTTGAAPGDRGSPDAERDPLAPPAPIVPDVSSSERRAIAEQYGLKQMGVRPPLGKYIRDVASRWAQPAGPKRRVSAWVLGGNGCY